MAEMYAVSGETLTGIADAIRSKTGSDEMMPVAAMAPAIEGISVGGLTIHVADRYTSGAGNCFRWAESLGIAEKKMLLLLNPTVTVQLCTGFLVVDGVPKILMQSGDGMNSFETRVLDYESVAGCNILEGSKFIEINLMEE